MQSLLEHFTREGRSLGRWLTAIPMTAEAIEKAFPDAKVNAEFSSLCTYVNSLSKAKLIKRTLINDTSRAFSPAGFRRRVDIFPIGPSSDTQNSFVSDSLMAVSRKSAVREVNRLSVILVVSAINGCSACNFLLTGDAGPSELSPAVEIWRTVADECCRTLGFRVIKIPHHGSMRFALFGPT